MLQKNYFILQTKDVEKKKTKERERKTRHKSNNQIMTIKKTTTEKAQKTQQRQEKN